MFIDKEWRKEVKKIPNDGSENGRKNFVFIIIGVMLLAVLVVFLLVKKPVSPPLNNSAGVSGDPDNNATSSIGVLPSDLGNGNKDQYAIGTSTNGIKAEDLTFGHFYKKPENNSKPTVDTYDLPVNIKVNVTNYHDMARKVNLDPYIDHLNQYGFAVMDKSEKYGDFFTAFSELSKKEVPIIITEDFITYYYQNTLKQVFKEVEKNAFYDNIWQINKKMYDIALARYKNDLEEKGLVNDPILEGERLELAFFAVSLELLRPKLTQIDNSAKLSDNNLFSPQEIETYAYDLPDYLKIDVDKEIELIDSANKISKSPILLYEQDYKKFIIPSEYKNNARLHNFYLATKWMNSLFPLFNRDEFCENCLLDQTDWVINMTAASYIAKDLYDNQDLKNQWAIIYKFISFFTGLRSELTYLNYYDVLSRLFGKDYQVGEIFGRENKDREVDIYKIREELRKFQFASLEGGIDRKDSSYNSYLGMRLLQDVYWPNDYLMDYLTGTEMIFLDDPILQAKNNLTYCRTRRNNIMYRCNGFSYDILNVIDSVDLNSTYFRNNTNYYKYSDKVDYLREKIDDFDVFTWNNNVYWTTLDIAKNILRNNNENYPIYTRSSEWRTAKDYKTFLGTWVNLHLNSDEVVSYFEQEQGGLGVYTNCNQFNYIEPNIELLDEMTARNDMLIKMMMALKVAKNTNAAAEMLKELNIELSKIMDISKKELRNESLSNDDCKFINDLMKYVVNVKGNKNFEIQNEIRKLTESISNVKVLAVVYKKGEKLILAFGPMFDFIEK